MCVCMGSAYRAQIIRLPRQMLLHIGHIICGVLSYQWTIIYLTTLSPKVKETLWTGKWECLRGRGQGKMVSKQSSGQDRNDVLMNSGLIQLLIQDLQKIISLNILSRRQKKLMSTHSQMINYGQFTASRGGWVSSLCKCGL